MCNEGFRLDFPETTLPKVNLSISFSSIWPETRTPFKGWWKMAVNSSGITDYPEFLEKVCDTAYPAW